MGRYVNGHSPVFINTKICPKGRQKTEKSQTFKVTQIIKTSYGLLYEAIDEVTGQLRRFERDQFTVLGGRATNKGHHVPNPDLVRKDRSRWLDWFKKNDEEKRMKTAQQQLPSIFSSECQPDK